MQINLPHEIVIELSNKCNLNCDFCFQKQEEFHSNMLSKKDIFLLLEEISNSGISAVRFTGGEPFLRKDLKEILVKAKSLNLYVILNTNATLITEKNKNIFDYVDLALFSLHYSQNFPVITEKINLLKNKTTKIMLATITTAQNIKNLNLFYDFVSKLDKTNFFEWFLLRQIPNKLNNSPLSKENLYKLYKKIKKYNSKYNLNVKIANALPFCAIKKDLYLICKGGAFDSGYTRLIINSEGNYKLDYSSKNSLGNIKNKKVMEVWNSKQAKEVRNYKKIKKNCEKCYYLQTCKGGLLEKEYLQNFENKSCLASVIIPTFNDSKRLLLLIKSLENQTCNNFEIIVVDDGSIDNTKETVMNLQKTSSIKIKYLYLDNKNIFGTGLARNFGAKHAKSNILIFLDQDNVTHQKLIENYIHWHETNDILLGYYAGYGNKKNYYNFQKLKIYIEKNKIIKTIIPEFRTKIFNNPENYFDQEWKYFVSANFSIKKNLFLKFQFDENIIQWGGQDIELGYRLVKNKHRPIFCKNCVSYNNSDKKIFDKKKFISSMEVLSYIFDKHKTEELKQYCFERFDHTPQNIRGDSTLTCKKGKLIFAKPNNYCFIRIDDVYHKNKNFLNIINFTIKNSIPVNLQIIPNLIKLDFINFLKNLKQKYPCLMSFNQHGYNHKNYNPKQFPKYEFGDGRSYENQKKDIVTGVNILNNAFNSDFVKIFTPPFHKYNKDTLKILKELNFDFISLKNTSDYKDKKLLNLPVNFDIIKSYNPDIFLDKKELFDKVKKIYDYENYMGIVLHPKKMNSKEFKKFKELILIIKSLDFNFILAENLKNKIYPDAKNKSILGGI